MKKRLSVVLALVMAFSFTAGGVGPVEAGPVRQDIKLDIFGRILDQEPKMGLAYIDENNRTLVPIRLVSESLGHRVAWDQEEKKVLIDDNIYLVIGEKFVVVDGRRLEMDSFARIEADNRTYVPLRFVSEALGYKVSWNKASRTASIGEKDKLVSNLVETNPADTRREDARREEEVRREEEARRKDRLAREEEKKQDKKDQEKKEQARKDREEEEDREAIETRENMEDVRMDFKGDIHSIIAGIYAVEVERSYLDQAAPALETRSQVYLELKTGQKLDLRYDEKVDRFVNFSIQTAGFDLEDIRSSQLVVVAGREAN